jgi:Fe-S-cluster containining protein
MRQTPKTRNKRLSPQSSEASDGLEWEARRAQRLRTSEILRGGRRPLDVITVAEQAIAVTDEGIRECVKQHPPHPPLACAEGCAWCCHKVVGCAPPEVLRIVAYLQEHLSAEEIENTCKRIIEVDEQRRDLKHDSWASKRLACPLLVDERCSVYPVRPLTCRGFNSTDARQCELSASRREPVEVPIHTPSHRLATFVLDGMRAGLGEAGLKGELLELCAALRVALTVPDAAGQWLAGQPTFTAAKLI